MKFQPTRRLSLLWKVLLCTSIVTTLLIGVTAWRINRYALGVTEGSLEREIQASLHEYEYIWRVKADNLARLTLLLSTMSDVRAAFSTGDTATIRDTAKDLWTRVSDQGALFLVLDPQGSQIASLGGNAQRPLAFKEAFPRLVKKFPSQSQSFVKDGGQIYYLVLTPVYVESPSGPALLDVLAAGFALDQNLAQELKRATHGSEFAIVSEGKTLATTLDGYSAADAATNGRAQITVKNSAYNQLTTPLEDDLGHAVGEIRILRPSEPSRRLFRELQVNVSLLWVVALAGVLVLSALLVRQLVKPLTALDEAATEIANRNYDYRVPLERDDEFGRLAKTFNSMCDSIQRAREDLIHQEQLNTVGRISSSIVHDLRNPLAAIYGGAEMLIDTPDMPPEQSRRLAMNIYKASRRIQEMLNDLTQGLSGGNELVELCRLHDLLESCVEIVGPAAQAHRIEVRFNVPEELEVPVQRGKIERVFLNLLNNAIEAMESGGWVEIRAERDHGSVLVAIEDNGPGIDSEIRKQLFRPFVSAGKRQGLGLGLALARRAVLSGGGDLWLAEKLGHGARFCVRLPLERNAVGVAAD